MAKKKKSFNILNIFLIMMLVFLIALLIDIFYGSSGIFNINKKTEHQSLCIENLSYYYQPYVMAWNQTTEVIKFQTNIPANATIEYGTSANYGFLISNPNFETKNEFFISKLIPDTLYYYKINLFNVDKGLCNKNTTFNSYFRTSYDLKENFSFAVIGDIRSGSSCGTSRSNYPGLVQKISEKNPDFILMTGDLVYADYSGCNPYDSWRLFNSASEILAKKIPILNSVGNHENLDDINAREAYNNYWAFPLNGNGFSNEWKETTYMWRYGNSLFIFLNTEESNSPGDINEKQLEWLSETALPQKKYANKFVLAHKSLANSRRKDTLYGFNPLKSILINDLMNKNNVTAAFYGHDHLYCYNDDAGNGTMLNILSGGGGSPLSSDLSACIGLGILKHNYMIINVTGDKISGTVYDDSDAVIHRFK